MSQVKSTNTQQPKKKLVSNKALFSIIAVVAGLLVGLLISAIAGFDIGEIAQQ
jgi:preprotein translocase subunit Sec63